MFSDLPLVARFRSHSLTPVHRSSFVCVPSTHICQHFFMCATLWIIFLMMYTCLVGVRAGCLCHSVCTSFGSLYLLGDPKKPLAVPVIRYAYVCVNGKPGAVSKLRKVRIHAPSPNIHTLDIDSKFRCQEMYCAQYGSYHLSMRNSRYHFFISSFVTF